MLFQDEKMNKVKDDRRKHNGIEKFWDIKNKNERKSSLKHSFFSFPPTKKKTHSGKVSLCTSYIKRASMAVETALVLPLFFFGVVAMISFMDIYAVQTEHLTKLCENAKKAGMYAYLAEGVGAETITLPDIYSYKPVSGFLSLPAVHMVNIVEVHAWTGKAYGAGNVAGETNDKKNMVYMTETGNVYHTNEECTYLRLSIKNISGSQISSVRNLYGEKYHACESCSRNQKPATLTYITDTGNRYHNLATCSGLKRSVRLVDIEEAAENYHLCNRCGGEKE